MNPVLPPRFPTPGASGRRRAPGAARVLALLVLAITTAAGADAPATMSPATSMAEAGMVDIRSLVPDMAENIHSAGRDNFTGAPVPGYDAARCYLLQPAA